jgi:hypothetical protein
VPDGAIALRATAFLPGGTGTTVERNIVLDRTAPVLTYRTFTPERAQPGTQVTIEVGADDLGTGVERTDVYVNTAADGSSTGAWVLLGSVVGNQGSVIWDTSGYSEGWHRVAFGTADKAGNWSSNTEMFTTYDLRLRLPVYLPLVLSQVAGDVPPGAVTPAPTVTHTSTARPTNTATATPTKTATPIGISIATH